MKKIISIVALAGLAGIAHADLIAETGAKFASSYALDYNGGTPNVAKMSTVFDNLSSGPVNAFSSTDLEAVFGDTRTLTGTGLLQGVGFGVFNSSGSGNANPLNAATVDINFFRASDSSFIGGLGVNIAPSLAPGFFSTFTVSGLEGLGINLDTTEVIMTQTLRAGTVTGGTIRAGVVNLSPVTVGTAADSLFIDAADVGGGAAGFYTIGGAPFFLAGQVVVPAPASAALLGLGGLAAIRRRR